MSEPLLSAFFGLRCWLFWANRVFEDTKARKIPYSVLGSPWRAGDLKSCGLFAAAASACRTHGGSGLGIALGYELPDGTAIAGLDLDSCIANGEIAEWAKAIVRWARSVTEISPSGTGLKIFFLFRACDLKLIHEALGGDALGGVLWKGESVEHPPAIEIYFANRYFAYTGNALPGSPAAPRMIETQDIVSFIQKFPRRRIGIAQHDTAPELGTVNIDTLWDRIEAAAATNDRLAATIADTNHGRSELAWRLSGALKDAGFEYAEIVAALEMWGPTADWTRQKGHADDDRELKRLWERRPPAAVSAIAAEPAPVITTPASEVPIPHSNPNFIRTGAAAFRRAPTSEMSIAFSALNVIKDLALWNCETGQWMTWEGLLKGWQIGDRSAAVVRNQIEAHIIDYVDRHSGGSGVGTAGWSESQKAKLMSRAKVRNVEETLRDKLGSETGTVNGLASRYKIQTPAGVYHVGDITSPVSTLEGKLLYDTRCTAVVPRQGATPKFDNLIIGLADGDPEVANWLLHYLGYSLLGHPREDCFVVVWGPGGNGKTVLQEVLQHILSSYAVALDNSVLLESGRRRHPASLNRLRYKRLALVSEVPKSEKWNEAILKKITGGDEIEARDMGKNPTTFTSEAGLLIVCNDMPVFSRVDPSILRRFRMIGTTRKPENPNKFLREEIIQHEGPAVLYKIMEAAHAVFRAGVTLPDVPASMLREANDTLMEQDTFFAWLKAECNTGRNAVKSAEPLEVLRARYEAYLGRQGSMVDKVTVKAMTVHLRKLGLRPDDEKIDPQGRVLVPGVSLKVKAA